MTSAGTRVYSKPIYKANIIITIFQKRNLRLRVQVFTGDLGSIPGSGRSPGEENGNPLQYSCLENPMDGRA